YLDTDYLDQAILSLVDQEQTVAVFFDPVDGFYCYEGTRDRQREVLTELMQDYCVTETVRDHEQTACLMPSSRKKSEKKQESGYIWVSEIVRRAVEGELSVKGKKNIVFVMNFASRLDACNRSSDEANTMFLNLMAATTTPQRFEQLCNTIVLVVDKYNDIPAWVYLNNPNIRTITIETPDRNTRRSYLENLSGDLAPFALLSRTDYDPGKQFVAETEGMQLRELRQILLLAFRKDLKPDDIGLAFRLYKYGVLDDPWERLENDILLHIESTLEKRVKGQEEALNKVKTVVTRAVKGLSGLQHSGASHKPKGIFFFAGPTGVGKTETAKALAEAIFGDENACIRFDMSEYRLEQSDQKLFGAPPGYVGYEGGGQLTNAVKNRPFSVILFDEIEKASPTIMDKFLQILEDGRMTDNQGNTVYFGETIIIFTSNIGLTKEVVDPGDSFGVTRHRVATLEIQDPETPDPPEFRARVTRELTEGVKNYFRDIGRPELLNRLGDDNIVVFQFINVEDAAKICDAKLKSICAAIEKEKGIRILVDDAREELHRMAVRERANGGRGVGNMLEREFLNPLSTFLCTLPDTPQVLRCQLDDDKKVVFEVMLGET
ncbi:MAG: ATP-dependent Clp protease ATP-binding subunit, partial [Oscillospiraceae bacterium]|nr:ATP-dependent Clp protease ATP-binding subunit [Oscillospiraceae bacterium]